MDNNELENEIEILKKRIEILEKQENRRRIFKSLRIVAKIVIILLIVFSIYRGYVYVTENIPNIIETKIKETVLGKK